MGKEAVYCERRSELQSNVTVIRIQSLILLSTDKYSFCIQTHQFHYPARALVDCREQ